MKSLMDGTMERGAKDYGERGSAIVFSLIILTSLMTLGVLFYNMAARTAREVNSNVDDQRAHYLADAALAEAMIAVRAKAPGNGAVASQANPAYLGSGVLWVTSTDLGANRTRLVSTAMVGGGRASIEAVVELEIIDPIFFAVLNSRETLTLNADVVIDSYDSELGDYVSQAVNTYGGYTYANDDGDITSNEGIALSSGATVFGDASPGPGYAVSMAASSYVSGSTAPATTAFSFPPIPVPTVTSSGPYSVPINGTATLPAGTYGFDAFTLNKAAKLTINGPATLVVTDFTGGKDARLTIDASAGPVTIFVQGNYSHMSNFEAQPAAGSPMALAFMVQGNQDVVFPALSKVRGAYYVPNANVLFGSSNEAWGSFAANRVDMSSSMRFHYDESLSKYWDAGNGKDPLRLLAWFPTSVTPANLLRNRRDPFQVLGVNKAALLSPANSW